MTKTEKYEITVYMYINVVLKIVIKLDVMLN